MTPPSPTDRESVGPDMGGFFDSPTHCPCGVCSEIRKERIVKELQAKLKCSWCGGTDLVCGKGHIEATDELKKQVRDAEAKLSH